MKEITLVVPQGIGDTFWVYQKFSPYFDRINFKVPVSHASALEMRSLAWLPVLPKCGKVEAVHRPFEMGLVAPPMQPILDAWADGQREFEYCCNKNLEYGERLEAIDPAHEVQWNVNVRVDEASRIPFKGYIAIFVSGTTINALKMDLWSVVDWIEFIHRFYERYNLWELPALILGASWDKPIAEALSSGIKDGHFGMDIKNEVWLDHEPSEVLKVLDCAKFFIGYQSGLGIMADNLGVPQVMMYFNWLERMRYSWCQPLHARRVYFAGCFRQSPKEIIESLPAEFEEFAVNDADPTE